MTCQTSSEKLSIAQTLQRVSAHLDSLAEQVNLIEEVVGASIKIDRVSALPIGQLQKLDFLRQSLEDCALLMHFVSQSENAVGIRIDRPDLITEKLKLGATRGLLGEYKTLTTDEDEQSGDVDLF